MLNNEFITTQNNHNNNILDIVRVAPSYTSINVACAARIACSQLSSERRDAGESGRI